MGERERAAGHGSSMAKATPAAYPQLTTINYQPTTRPLSIVATLVMLLALAPAASAHETVEGGEWVMADWMVSTFFIFAGGAMLAFLAALKAGWLSNVEDAKYYLLEFEEPDYWSPVNAADDDEVLYEP